MALEGEGATLEVLRGMWGEMKALNSRVDGLRTEMQTEFRALRSEMREGFREVREEIGTLGRRIDNVLLGAHGREHADLRERVVRLEVHAGLPPWAPSAG